MSVNLKKKSYGKQEDKTTSWRDLNDVHRWVTSRNGMALFALFCIPISKDKCIVVLKDGISEKRLVTCYYEERR